MKRLLLIFFTSLMIFACSSHTTDFSIIFENVEGLKEGDKVVVKGKEIGEITRMKLYKNKVLVDVAIEKDNKIPLSSKFVSETKDLLGGRMISVELGETGELLQDKDTVNGIVNTYSFDPKTVDSLQVKGRLAEPVKKILAGASDLVDSLATGRPKK